MENNRIQPIDLLTCTIANGGTQSTPICTDGFITGTFSIPAAFTGTAVTVKFGNIKDGTFTAVPDMGDESNPQTVTTNGTYYLPLFTCSAKYFVLVSGSSEGADRTISVFLKS